MEGRHWWIASKIQDTFSIGGTSNPSLLEEYICEPETLDLINELFVSGGIRRLFFYVKRVKGNDDNFYRFSQLNYQFFSQVQLPYTVVWEENGTFICD